MNGARYGLPGSGGAHDDHVSLPPPPPPPRTSNWSSTKSSSGSGSGSSASSPSSIKPIASSSASTSAPPPLVPIRDVDELAAAARPPPPHTTISGLTAYATPLSPISEGASSPRPAGAFGGLSWTSGADSGASLGITTDGHSSGGAAAASTSASPTTALSGASRPTSPSHYATGLNSHRRLSPSSNSASSNSLPRPVTTTIGGRQLPLSPTSASASTSGSSSSSHATPSRGGGGASAPPTSSNSNLGHAALGFLANRLRSPRRMKAWVHAVANGSHPLGRILVVGFSTIVLLLFLFSGAPPRTSSSALRTSSSSETSPSPPPPPRLNDNNNDQARPFAKYLPFSFLSSSSSSSSASTDQNNAPISTIPSTRQELAQALFDEDPNTDGLAYRRFLERTTSPEEQMTHSQTMTFDHIYVLSLPTRQDRRDEMRRLANALGVNLTFVDAALKDEPFIQWIGERVAETRELRRRVMAKARKNSPSSIGGLHIGSDWLTPYLDKKHKKVFPPFPSDRKRYPSGNWITHLEMLHSIGNHTSLRPVDPNFDLAKALNDPLEEYAVRQVHEGIISTYWGQTRALKEVVTNGDRSALILEDDVDVEWDLERLWSRIQRKLPEDWDVTFLGHCWSREYITPYRLHPLVHASVMPMCLHGWAVSADGAQRLLSTFLDPWSAYSTAVDLVLPTMIRYHRVAAYSIQPPLIIQRKDGPSDLQEGSGSRWRGVLRDSTVERLARDEGSWEGDKPFDPANIDPGTKLRMGWCPSEDDDGKDGEGR